MLLAQIHVKYSLLKYSSDKIILLEYFVTPLEKIEKMKTISKWEQIDQYHDKCVCQTCTCHKHTCPKCDVHSPFEEISSYQNDYHKHPINTWTKAPPEKAKPYEPYGNISSSYQSHFPGHKPHMREKIIPRVKNQDKNIPFEGQSEYKNKFYGKSVNREPIKNKDKIYTPDNQPFEGLTTYKSSYIKKEPNVHEKRPPVEYGFPDRYKFDGGTTYGNSYSQKPWTPVQSYKPPQSHKPTGQHDLNTIYRKDYDEKKIPEPCPVLKMPQRPHRISNPAQHLVYNKHRHRWEQK